jgi:transposase
VAKAANIQLPKELLEQIYAEVEARVERKFEDRIKALEKKCARLEEERDAWRTRYFKEQERALALQGKLELAEIKIKELEALVERQRVQIEKLQNQLHGKKSEVTPPAPQEPAAPKRARGRQPGSAGHGRKQRNEIEPEEHIHDFTANERHCSVCGLPYEDVSEKTSEEIHVEYKLVRRVHRRRTIRKTCQCPGVPMMKTAPAPDRLFKGSLLSTDTWSNIIFDKYHLQRPLNRVRQWLKSLGLEISQGTITNAFKRLHERQVFKPLVEEIRQRVSASKHQQKDESGWKVFQKLEGKEGYAWWLWLTLGADCALFQIDPSRSREVAKQTIGEDPVVLSSDCLSVYHNMGDNVTNAWCWSHVRRWFLELKRFKGLSGLSSSWVKKVDQLFHINNLRLSSSGRQYDAHDTALKQAIAEFERQAKRNAKRSGMHPEALKVFRSVTAHWLGLTVFVRLPGIPMHNNASERALRNPVVGRKNYYGSGAHWSASFTADLFTILTTLEYNGINARLWLIEYLHAVAGNNCNAPPNAASFLPWNSPPVDLLLKPTARA